MATTLETNTSDRLHELFITGLKNAHGLEHQALSIMEPQVSHLEHYPQVADRLREHIQETHGQIKRLEEILDDLHEDHSSVKDAVMSFTGTMAAVGHSFAGDEILKNSFANFAFENFEIASYKSLITMADEGSFGNARSLLEQTLSEEHAMADWIDQHLAQITHRYVELSAQKGSREARA